MNKDLWPENDRSVLSQLETYLELLIPYFVLFVLGFFTGGLVLSLRW